MLIDQIVIRSVTRIPRCRIRFRARHPSQALFSIALFIRRIAREEAGV